MLFLIEPSTIKADSVLQMQDSSLSILAAQLAGKEVALTGAGALAGIDTTNIAEAQLYLSLVQLLGRTALHRRASCVCNTALVLA